MAHSCACFSGSSEHVVQFYGSDAFLASLVADFARDALIKGDTAMVVATPEHLGAIHERLLDQVPGFPAFQSSGHYIALNAAETLPRLMAGDLPSKEAFDQFVGRRVAEATERGSRLHIFGEMVALLAARGNMAAATQLESFWNQLRSQYPFSLLCAYPLHLFRDPKDAAHFISVCDLHSRVIPAESFSRQMPDVDQARTIAALQLKDLTLQSETQERQLAEAQLHHAQDRFRSFVVANASVVWVADLAGRVKVLESIAESVAAAGGDLNALEGDGWLALVHPEDRPAVIDQWRAILNSDKPARLEYRVCGLDDSFRHIQADVAPVFNSDGTIREWIGTCRDITRRKMAEENLKQSEAMRSMAARLSRVGGWSAKFPGGTLTWSEEVRAIHEAPPHFNPSIEEAINFYPPEFRATIQHAFQQCVEHGTPFDLELQIVTANSRRTWVRAIGEAVRDTAGRINEVRGAFQDISDIKEAALLTRKLADELTNTLESITDAFFTLDREWHFRYINKEGERLLQRNRNDLFGTVIWDAFPESVGSKFELHYRRAMEQRTPVEFEEFYPPLQTWFEVRAFPSAEGLAVYFRDVTGKKRDLEVIRAGEERFNLLCKATNDAIWDVDLRNGSVWWSEAFQTVFGFSPEEGDDLDKWAAFIHPKDRDRVVHSFNAAVESAVGKNWVGEYLFRRKDGSYAYVLDRGFIVRDQHGVPIRMFGSTIDMSDRQEAQRQLAENEKHLLNAQRIASLGSWDYNFLTDTLSWSEELYRIFGVAKADFVPNYSGWLRYVHPKDLDRVEKTVENCVRNRSRIDYEHRIIRPDGQIAYIHERGEVIYDEVSGDPIRTFGTAQDITERKQLEAQFLRAQRMDSIGTLAGGIAHDLNNVLAPILMSVHILRSSIKDPQAESLLDTVESCSRRGANLIKQVLSYARGVDGKRLNVNPVDVARDVHKIVEETFPKNISCHFNASPKLWSFSGDSTQLHQVLVNLCVNARDAMPNGGRLDISLENCVIDDVFARMNSEARPGKYVLIKVTDSGHGIPPDLRERIFEPFFTTKDIGAGTGLGLSTCLGIVRSHGGFITLSSDMGQGSTFSIYLPAHFSKELDDGENDPQELPTGNGELILIVDDEEAVRKVAQATLEYFGYKVMAAAHGAEAIAIYAQHQKEIAAVFTDMVMPILDGPSMIAALKALNPKVKIIASSGYALGIADPMAKNAGVRHFITKPYSASTMLTVLNDALKEPA